MYPQTNGQVEVSKQNFLASLKKCLDNAKGKRVEELPRVLWAYKMTPRKAIGETPISLAYYGGRDSNRDWDANLEIRNRELE